MVARGRAHRRLPARKQVASLRKPVPPRLAAGWAAEGARMDADARSECSTPRGARSPLARASSPAAEGFRPGLDAPQPGSPLAGASPVAQPDRGGEAASTRERLGALPHVTKQRKAMASLV